MVRPIVFPMIFAPHPPGRQAPVRRWRCRAFGAAVALFFGAILAGAAPDPAGELRETPLAPRSGPPGATLFTEVPPAQSGVQAENKYDDPRMWGSLYHEFEVGPIGTGVAIGDYDGDGRPDIFVVSKTESCRLFRNLGHCKFQDVTDQAGVGDKGDAARIWKEGACFVDVNNDGRLDIYVCRFGAPNLLYINQGDGTFKEAAHAAGLDVVDGCTMATFGDYDRDGWLDVYIQTNLLNDAEHPAGQRDYLFHNNGDGTFTNVTDRAGISPEDTQGNSAMWWDYDNDGWPDLYVANDFAPADRLYHNNRDGTFTNVIDATVPHCPYSSMGSDLGDVNNDGRIDFMVADMAATTHLKDQRTTATTRARARDPNDGNTKVLNFPRNALYLNTGTDRCLEAAFLTGLDATDWTWSIRLEDLDNDGRLDVFATNGMHREIHNADLIRRMMAAESAVDRIRIARSGPVLAEANLAFRNLGDLRFENVSAAWGLNQKGVSFGAALGDLEGDGNLDIVYTNYLAGPTLLRNDCATGHSIEVDLRGTLSNRFGIGATVRIETASGTQVRQLWIARGYMSSSEPMVHFGLGNDTAIRRLTVAWPSGQQQEFQNLAADRRFTITEPTMPPPVLNCTDPPAPATEFADVTAATGLAVTAREAPIDELAAQPLLPMRLNRRGPAVAVADLNGDKIDDLVIGGTALDPVRVLLGSREGKFTAVSIPGLDRPDPLDDGPLLIFDADGDGSQDLLVTKGGNSLPPGSLEYQPALWLNDGSGHFRPAPAGSLPQLLIDVGAAAAADFDHSGRLGVFLGGRVIAGQYPIGPNSALLANRGGTFEDVTDAVAPALREAGMVTAALWSDVDGDGWPDLLVAIDWGGVKYFHNDRGRHFEDWSDRAGFSAAGTGWWRSLATADFNGDGRPDFVAGNVGLNTQYRATQQHPALLFAGDFKGDGGTQLIEGYYEGDTLYPWRTRSDLGAAIPSILQRFPRNDLYARATLEEIAGRDNLAHAEKFAATELRSGVFLSQPDGTYRFDPLPRIAQIAPFDGVVAGDFDGDGNADIYAVQNTYAPTPVVGYFDGGLSQLLRGDGHGHFTPAPVAETGLSVPGDPRGLAVLDLDGEGWPDFVTTRSNSASLAFRNRGLPNRHSLRLSLRGPAGNPTAVGARISLEYADGSVRTAEVQAGAGLYSQSVAACYFGFVDANPPRQVRVRWPAGNITTHPVPAAATELTLTMGPP